MNITGEIFFTSYGPAVRVNVEGEERPWEFSLRHRPRTPLQRRACELRGIEFVRARVEPRRHVYTFPSMKRADVTIVAGYDSAEDAREARAINVYQGRTCSPITLMSRIEESKLQAELSAQVEAIINAERRASRRPSRKAA